jgi:glycine betaine/proline transport system permease protein
LNNTKLKDSRNPSVRDAVTQKGLTEIFIGSNSAYYEEQFRLIGSTSTFTFTFNIFAALLGPIWFGLRGIWNWAFAFVIFEAFAFVQIIRGMFGDLAIDERGRLMTVVKQISLRQDQLKSAIQKGSDDLGAFERNIRSLQGILDELKMDIIAAEDSRIWIISLSRVFWLILFWNGGIFYGYLTVLLPQGHRSTVFY